MQEIITMQALVRTCIVVGNESYDVLEQWKELSENEGEGICPRLSHLRPWEEGIYYELMHQMNSSVFIFIVIREHDLTPKW
jgi:hypothetical protein